MPILLIAEHDNQTLKAATRNALTAAQQLGEDVHVLVAGNACDAVAQAAAKLAGVSIVKVADAPHYADHLAENLAALVMAAVSTSAGGYTHVLAAATASGKNFMPRVAALLDVAQITDVIAVESADTFVRPTYAGNILSTVTSADSVKVITVRTTAFDPAGDGGNAIIEPLAAVVDAGLSKVIGREMTVSERPELTTARVIVTGGRGLASGENYHRVLDPLADRLNAALGATRAAVDAGYVPNDFQVGQTGKIVAPQLYFAIGVSGAIQHLAGMKESKVIVAINKDPDAPIFQVADYGLVADLFVAVPELTQALG